MPIPGSTRPVLACAALAPESITALAARYGVRAVVVARDAEIPGSFWGAPEAGLVGDTLYYRPDTPAHSLLHELAHVVCMDPARRGELHTNAGGDDLEECAVCYLEVLLADDLPPFNRERCLADMDAWGYSFREGRAASWFRGDGQEAREWLELHGLVDAGGKPTYRRREAPDVAGPVI
jgi:hypothetical protein